MAAGLGYKEFTTGDVLTAADANGYLASQVVMVFDDAADRTADLTSPEEGMISYLKDSNAVEKYDGAAWVAVAAAGGGKVLQVVTATHSTAFSTTNSAFQDTGLTVTITPSLATSKVLVIVAQASAVGSSGTNGFMGLEIDRGGTSILNTQNRSPGYSTPGVSGGSASSYQSLVVLDSPATTSATTYKTRVRSGFSATTTATVQDNSATSTITVLEIGA